MSDRIDKINYYLDIAETVASRATCLRKKYGTVIVNHDQIISTGYNGAPRGRVNCSDVGYCTKKKLLPDQRHGGYDACRAVHSEQNAIISASREEMMGGTIYLVGYTQNFKDKTLELELSNKKANNEFSLSIGERLTQAKEAYENTMRNKYLLNSIRLKRLGVNYDKINREFL